MPTSARGLSNGLLCQTAVCCRQCGARGECIATVSLWRSSEASQYEIRRSELVRRFRSLGEDGQYGCVCDLLSVRNSAVLLFFFFRQLNVWQWLYSVKERLSDLIDDRWLAPVLTQPFFIGCKHE